MELEPPTSCFWKRLSLALPVRPLALGRRIIDSTSSHSDLADLFCSFSASSRMLPSYRGRRMGRVLQAAMAMAWCEVEERSKV